MLQIDGFDWRAITIFIVLWCGFTEICFLVLRSSYGAAVRRFDTVSFLHKQRLAGLLALSLTAPVVILLTRDPWVMGDGSSHREILTALQSEGPYFLNPFMHVTGLPGPPYPQSFHVLLVLFSKLFGVNYVTDIALMLLGQYGGFCLPFILNLYGRKKFRHSVFDHTIFLISLMFASVLTYDLSLGTLPYLQYLHHSYWQP